MEQIISPNEPTETATPAAGAASRLVHDAGIDRGITRKSGKRGFLYYAADGKRISDRTEVTRLTALAIPPAYTDVVISADPAAHLQALGTDARGRRQYRYHPDWQAERGREKFERLAEFGARLPDIRARVDFDLARRGLSLEKALATVVWMLDNLFIRIGNSSYAISNGSYGVTTLRNRHVSIEGASVTFKFRGKSGKAWRLVHSDRRIANVIRRLQELPGQHLFQYACEDGNYRPITSQDVNDYIKDASGSDFSSRQFRTWGATCLAAASLAPLDAAISERALPRQINAAVDTVAARMVNTRAVCRGSYIHPAVFEDFKAGRLSTMLRMKTTSRRLLDWMDEDEIRLLRWLKSQQGTAVQSG